MVENVTDLTKLPETRAFHFATGGDNDNNGSTYNLAFATPEKSIERCNALIPVPGIGNAAAAISFGAGLYRVEIDDLDFILFIASGVNLLNKIGVLATVKLGIVASLECNSVQNEELNGIAVLCDGKARTGINCKFITSSGGGDAVCLRVTGMVDDLFVDVNQIVVQFNVGIFDDSTNLNPISYDLREITQADGTTAIRIANGRKTLNLGSIVPSALGRLDTGSVGLHVTGGSVVDAEITVMAAFRPILVDADSILNLTATTVKGDIVVNTDGVLNCNIAKFTGTVSPSDPGNGRINGIIGGVRYGNARVLDEIVLRGIDTTQQDPSVGPGAEMQVSFGAAQSNDVVSIDADGTMTIHKIAQLKFKFVLQPGRDNAGGIAFLFFRLLVDGAQEGEVKFIKLDGPNDDPYMEIHIDPLNLAVDQEVKLIMVRGIAGMDDGSLMVQPTLQSGWSTSRSAVVTVIRTN